MTLVTCTRYGVNTHRLLVHAERCDIPQDWLDRQKRNDPVTQQSSSLLMNTILPLTLLGIAIAAAILLIARCLRRRRARRLGVEPATLPLFPFLVLPRRKKDKDEDDDGDGPGSRRSPGDDASVPVASLAPARARLGLPRPAPAPTPMHRPMRTPPRTSPPQARTLPRTSPPSATRTLLRIPTRSKQRGAFPARLFALCALVRAERSFAMEYVNLGPTRYQKSALVPGRHELRRRRSPTFTSG